MYGVARCGTLCASGYTGSGMRTLGMVSLKSRVIKIDAPGLVLIQAHADRITYRDGEEEGVVKVQLAQGQARLDGVMTEAPTQRSERMLPLEPLTVAGECGSGLLHRF